MSKSVMRVLEDSGVFVEPRNSSLGVLFEVWASDPCGEYDRESVLLLPCQVMKLANELRTLAAMAASGAMIPRSSIRIELALEAKRRARAKSCERWKDDLRGIPEFR